MKKLVPVLFLICCLSLPVLADGIPPDGIISTRPGSGSLNFYGSIVFTINYDDASCTPFNDDLVICGTLVQDPATGTFTSNLSLTLFNASGQILGKGGVGLLYSFGTFTGIDGTGSPAGVSQEGMRPPDGSDGTQFFELFTPIGDDAAFLTSNENFVLPGGGGIDSFAVAAAVVVDPCDPPAGRVNPCEWTTDFAEILVPKGGSTTVTITAPEPATAMLLLSGLGLAFWRRKARKA